MSSFEKITFSDGQTSRRISGARFETEDGILHVALLLVCAVIPGDQQ